MNSSLTLIMVLSAELVQFNAERTTKAVDAVKDEQTTSFEFHSQLQEEDNDDADFVDIENQPFPDKLELYFGTACKFPASDILQL
jgi:hypothetical protein